MPAKDFSVGADGLQIAVLVEGAKKAAVASVGDTVSVEYSGWLEDGTLFDSSYKRHDSFKFPLGAGRVIKGWDRGVEGMKVGEKRRLVIPAELAYGSRQKGQIPSNSTLIFDVELIEIMAPRVVPAMSTFSDEQYTVTASGLKYVDIVPCSTPNPTSGQMVRAEYTGWLTDGTLFDSSYKRADPIAFPVNTGRVSKGWDEALMSMSVGCRRFVVIPWALAYGEAGRPPMIPMRAELQFDIELVEID